MVQVGIHSVSRFLVFVLALCTAGSEAQRCELPVPGVRRLSRGIDITKLDLLPVPGLPSSSYGFKRSVFDLTCEEEKKWISPDDGSEYDLPDQVRDVMDEPNGWMDASTTIMKTSQDIRRSMSYSLEASISPLKGMFSASGSYKKNQESITNHSSFVEEVTSFVSGFRAEVQPWWVLQLSSNAQRLLDRLPETYDASPELYATFIYNYGTHHFSFGKFGGLLKLHMETKSSYYHGKSDADVRAEAKASFFNLIKSSGGMSGSQQTVDEQFKSNTEFSARYFGGDTNMLSSTGIGDWQPTVMSRPWLFGGALEPITDLIVSDSKREAMAKAIQVHLDLARLRELEKLLWTAMYKFPGMSSSIRDRLDDVQELIEGGDPPSEDVDALEESLYWDYHVPGWFSKTELCYRWYPDGDGGQCGGGAGRLLCATTGSRTDYYRDDTDGRGGGCQMSWGIRSQYHPQWFDGVQICYRWYPDGDGGQCGGGAQRNLCASVGDYTGYYRDDSDGRGGGCRMSWKLALPSNPPVWLTYARLCYQWYADGDGGQCGGGAATELCAPANSWTGYYRDDTDGRGGGCRMRWGIHLDL